MIHELAGKPAPDGLLIDVPKLLTAYYTYEPDPMARGEKVSFGTSGHRGSSFARSFNESHILAVCQAICDYRANVGIVGPLYLGKDTHALSEAAFASALEVFAGNNVTVRVQDGLGYTPTPVISWAILTYNRDRLDSLAKAGDVADGVIITPSHNPPEDGGLKYNPPTGGPASGDITALIETRANEILQNELKDVKRMSYDKALQASTTKYQDFMMPYIEDLAAVVDMEVIAASGLRIGVDPLGGSGLHYWEPLAEHYGLDMTIVNNRVDPTFGFMTVDKDGKIRMDCSSPYAMASLIELKDKYDIAFGNDPDFDRHGIVTPSCGLLNPNHYLAVAVKYLFYNRSRWSMDAAVGKTLVSSSMIDRVARQLDRKVAEVPVGFKWFVDGLLTGGYGFGGEESAGASFLRRDGTVWTTDKDGIIMSLLAAEITARTEQDPGEHYAALENQHGSPVYARVEAPATFEQKAVLKNLSPDSVTASELAGEPILQKLTRAPGNDALIGGLKVTTENGWFAARPSGTEDIYKIYAESFKNTDHLKWILDEAQAVVSDVFEKEL